MRVNPSMEDSYERLFHETGWPQFLLIFSEAPEATEVLRRARLERAIGVIYRPRTERMSHYFHATLPEQFDAVIHIDTTAALQPLETVAPFEPEEAETFPTGV